MAEETEIHHRIFVVFPCKGPNEPRLPPVSFTSPVGVTGEPNYQASGMKYETKVTSEVHDSPPAVSQLPTLEKVVEYREKFIHLKPAFYHYAQHHQESLGPIRAKDSRCAQDPFDRLYIRNAHYQRVDA